MAAATPITPPLRRDSVAQFAALVQLLTLEFSSRGFARFSRWLCRGALLGGLLMLVWFPTALGATRQLVVSRWVVGIAWLGALSALSVAAPAAGATANGVSRTSITGPALGLLALRGTKPWAMFNAEWVAGAKTVFSALGMPIIALGFAELLLTHTARDAARALEHALGLLLFAIASATLFGTTAVMSRRISPERGRTLLLALYLVPSLLEGALDIIGIPGLVSKLFDYCTYWGQVP